MSILSPLKKLLGGVGNELTNDYNKTLGNFTGNIGAFPQSNRPVNPVWTNFYNSKGPSHLQTPRQLQPFDNYQSSSVAAQPYFNQAKAPLPPFMVTGQYLNRFLPANQQLQPFGDQGEDGYSQTQRLQPTSYSDQASLNGQLTQGPLASFYRLAGR